MMSSAVQAFVPETSRTEVCEVMVRIETRLAASRAVIEQDFSEMGGRLADSARLLNEIAVIHAETAEALQGDEFRSAVGQLQDIRDRIREMIETPAGDHGYLDHLAGMAAAIGKPVTTLSKTVHAIGIVAVNARISAASLSEEKDDFTVFTMGMTRLALSAAEAVKALAASYGELSNSLAGARAVNADLSARQGQTVGQILSRLGNHLEVLEYHNARAAGKSGEYAKLVRQITSRVGAAVSALQIGDITRQRIEHVEEALESLRGSNQDGRGNGEFEALVAQVSNLQVAQLEDALPEFDDRVSGLVATLRDLASDASDLLRENDSAAESMLESGGTALAAMVEDLHRLRLLFQEVRDTRNSLAGVADNVMETFAVMTGHIDAVHKIEEDMRLVSLNTTIQCGRLGEKGRTLSVIAQELHHLTAETVAAAGAIMESLAEADEFVRKAASERQNVEMSDLDALETEASSAAEQIETIVERTREAVARVGRQAPQVIDLIGEAVKSAAKRQELSDNWRQAKVELEAFAAEGAGGAYETLGTDFFAALRCRYTMDSERFVHDRLLNIKPVVEAGIATETAFGEMDVDDLLF